jgi:hypothetical protein
MQFDFMTREVFDILIFIVFGIGIIAAAIRIYQDFTRPLPPHGAEDGRSSNAGVDYDKDDTQPHPPRE